jgi:hypothetical protein
MDEPHRGLSTVHDGDTTEHRLTPHYPMHKGDARIPKRRLYLSIPSSISTRFTNVRIAHEGRADL